MVTDEAKVGHLRVIDGTFFALHVVNCHLQLLLLELHRVLHLHHHIEELLLLFLGLVSLCLLRW